jgi:multidrug resistance efflux pump
MGIQDKENDPPIEYEINSEEVHEIVTAVPSWILRWGIALIFILMLSIVILSAFIRYPDIVKSNLKVNSVNAPKAVFAKQTGKIVSLLVKEGMHVKSGEILAFMESTGKHEDVLKLHEMLMQLNNKLIRNEFAGIALPYLSIGELQVSYQNFYQQYLQYVSTLNDGYYTNRKKYLQKDLKEITKLKAQLLSEQQIQKQEFANVEQEYQAYKKLFEKGVISKIEFKQQENKYLAGKYPLQQNLTSLINNNATVATKQKEIIDLEHIVQEERVKFIQSLGAMIMETESWINKYIVKAPTAGIVSFAGIIQENQTVNANQEIFIINPANTDFFGEVHIPQYNMGKVRQGQRTLIKMRSYPYEQFGLIRGKITYISDVAFNDSLFVAKVSFDKFENKDRNLKIVLKNGMQADVEIVTEESSLLQRFARNFSKIFNNN